MANSGSMDADKDCSMYMIDAEIDKARKELEQLRSARTQENLQNKLELQEIWQKMISTKRAMQARLVKSMHTQKGPPRVYVDSVKRSRSKDGEVVSQYVLSLEAQLCLNVHHMVTLEAQQALIGRQSHFLLESMKKALVREELWIHQMPIKTEYSLLDEEKRILEEEYRATIADQTDAIARFSQSDGLDIVAICRHSKDHTPIFIYETNHHQIVNNYKPATHISLSIRQLFRSGETPLAI